MTKRLAAVGLVGLLGFFLSGAGVLSAQTNKFVLMGSTIGPIDAGIVGLLGDEFEKVSGIRVRHVGAGTGAALDIARRGSLDLVMVHAKPLEETFVREGFGTERIDLMYNDFVIVGPPGDPAGIRGMKDAAQALKKISERQAPFISRGDRSGTHVAEMGLWEKAGIKPAGAWYTIYERGSTGNVPTLRFADGRSAYTVIDRASYLSLKDEVKVEILVEGDEALLNFITLIPVSPKRFHRVNHADAMAFVEWLTHPEKGQRIIKEFGKDRFGSPLFFPNSKQWRAAQGITN